MVCHLIFDVTVVQGNKKNLLEGNLNYNGLCNFGFGELAIQRFSALNDCKYTVFLNCFWFLIADFNYSSSKYFLFPLPNIIIGLVGIKIEQCCIIYIKHVLIWEEW